MKNVSNKPIGLQSTEANEAARRKGEWVYVEKYLMASVNVNAIVFYCFSNNISIKNAQSFCDTNELKPVENLTSAWQGLFPRPKKL